MPAVDYFADGLELPGVTILFDSDMVTTNCPISAKISLSSSEQRKKNNDVGSQSSAARMLMA